MEGGGLSPSESAHSERTEPVRLWNAEMLVGRIQDPPSSSLLRRGRALAALGSSVGDSVRDRLTLPQSLEALLALESPPSASMAGLLQARGEIYIPGRQEVSALLSRAAHSRAQPGGHSTELRWAQAGVDCDKVKILCSPHLSTRSRRPALL